MLTKGMAECEITRPSMWYNEKESMASEITGSSYHLARFVDNKMGDKTENMKGLSSEVVSADTERYSVCQRRSIAY